MFTTAHDALFTQCALRMGEHALVHAAAGGVGIAGVQLAALAGARVTATVRNPDLRDDVAAIGTAVGRTEVVAPTRSWSAVPSTSCSSSSAHRTSRRTSTRSPSVDASW